MSSSGFITSWTAPPRGPRSKSNPELRLVLLGASNLLHARPLIRKIARSHYPMNLEILSADGHGRSYGTATKVFWRGSPSIIECGIWEEIAKRPADRTLALVTDIGNDLAYEHPVDEIGSWIQECLRRLNDIDAKTIVTQLPRASIESLGAVRFFIMRSIFFPCCQLPLGEVKARAERLAKQISDLSNHHGAKLIEPKKQWYGLDPIHIRMTQRRRAWEEILGSLAER